jgi:CBS domain-containing protein
MAAGGPWKERLVRIVRDIMTPDPVTCAPSAGLRHVAQLMCEHDCGEIPICDDAGKPIGAVTDRDIVCRLVAAGENPLERTARDCMSQPIVTVTPDTSLEDCARLMEQHRIRRLPVVDGTGTCCGIVSQADLATKGSRQITAEVVEKVSERPESAAGMRS